MVAVKVEEVRGENRGRILVERVRSQQVTRLQNQIIESANATGTRFEKLGLTLQSFFHYPSLLSRSHSE